MLAAVVLLGMLTWWWPAYRSWGTTAVGLLVVLVLWLLWRTVSADRTVPGHPIYGVLLIPVLILTAHLARASLAAAGGKGLLLAGALDMSMIFQLALLALGVMLSQSLLPAAARHVSVLGVCGAAMMVGPAAAMVWGRAQPVRTALAMLGFAGIGVWLSMLWGIGLPAAGADGPAPAAGHRWRRIACVAVAVAAACGLTLVAPLQGVLAAGIVAGVLFLAGLVFPGRRIVLLTAGGGLTVAIVVALSAADWLRRAILQVLTRAGQARWLGAGEEAFREVSAADSGLVVLAGTIGWAGLAAFVAALAACVVWLMLHARRGHLGDQARAILWVSASAAAGCALLSPGGPFIPAVTLATAFVWGLLPPMLGRPATRRSGAYLLGGTVLVAAAMGIAVRPGLAQWSARVFGLGDSFLHVVMGFLLGLLLAWLLGAKRWWLGLVGIALAGLAGGPGEALQYLLATRVAEFRDWLYHGLGSVSAAVPYLLCLAARWCESADAPPRRAAVARAYTSE